MYALTAEESSGMKGGPETILLGDYKEKVGAPLRSGRGQQGLGYTRQSSPIILFVTSVDTDVKRMKSS